MAGLLAEGKMPKDYASWGYIWSQMQWKRRFIAISPGKLQVFSSDQRDSLKKKLFLNECTVKIVECTESQKASFEGISSSSFWQQLRRNSLKNQNLPEPEGAIVIIKSLKGGKLFILASNQDEAESWKIEIENAAAKPLLQEKRVTNSLLKILSVKFSASNGGAPSPSRLQRPLALRWEESNDKAIGRIPQTPELDTLQGCTELLKSSSFNKHAFQVAICMVRHFDGSYQMGDYSLPNELRIEAWKGTLLRVVKTLRDELLVDNSALVSCTDREDNMEQLWLACETWVMAAVHDKIMGACKQMVAAKDKQLAVILSKLSQVDSSLLGVRKDLKDIALGEAVQVFGMINSYRTPLEKAVCLRRTINCIMEGIQHTKLSCKADTAGTEDILPCTDDFLSLMLLLMAHAKVQHLKANACFLENFFHLHEQHGSQGELGYHITNFVAACDYLSSPEISNLVSGIGVSSSSSSTSSPRSDVRKSLEESCTTSSIVKLPQGPSNNATSIHSIDTHTALDSDTTGRENSPPEFILAPTYL